MIDSFLTTDHWAYTSPTTQYPYDPNQGQVLLDAAGWTIPEGEVYRFNAAGDILVLKLTTTQADFRYAWAEAFEQQMGNCGIWVERFHVDSPWLFGSNTGATHRDFELGAWTWSWGDEENPDVVNRFGCDYIPSADTGWLVGTNYVGWCNETASQTAEIAVNTELTQTIRLAAFATIQNEYANDMPSLPLFVRPGTDGIEYLEMNMFTIDTSTSTIITPEEGGVLTSTANLSTTITFPPNAVTEPITVTFDIISSHPISSGFGFVGHNFYINAITSDGTPVISFAEPFTITIQYSDSDIEGLDETGLVLNYWDTETSSWVEIPTIVDIDENKITVVLDHLTDFAVIGETQERIYLPLILLNY